MTRVFFLLSMSLDPSLAQMAEIGATNLNLNMNTLLAQVRS